MVIIYNFTPKYLVVCKIIRTFATEIRKIRYDYGKFQINS